MEGFIPYLGWVVLIVVIVMVVVGLKKRGLFVRYIKHSNTDLRESFNIFRIFLE